MQEIAGDIRHYDDKYKIIDGVLYLKMNDRIYSCN